MDLLAGEEIAFWSSSSASSSSEIYPTPSSSTLKLSLNTANSRSFRVNTSIFVVHCCRNILISACKALMSSSRRRNISSIVTLYREDSAFCARSLSSRILRVAFLSSNSLCNRRSPRRSSGTPFSITSMPSLNALAESDKSSDKFDTAVASCVDSKITAAARISAKFVSRRLLNCRRLTCAASVFCKGTAIAAAFCTSLSSVASVSNVRCFSDNSL